MEGSQNFTKVEFRLSDIETSSMFKRIIGILLYVNNENFGTETYPFVAFGILGICHKLHILHKSQHNYCGNDSN